MSKFQKLSPKSLALSLGIISGVSVLILGIMPLLFGGWGENLVSLIGGFYLGFDASISGAIIGGIYGFFDGLIGGWLIALLYNKLL